MPTSSVTARVDADLSDRRSGQRTKCMSVTVDLLEISSLPVPYY